MQKKVENTPMDLTVMAPNEEISLNFMDVKGKDVLVLKDKSSGFLYIISPRINQQNQQ